jgi:antitoxin MazE
MRTRIQKWGNSLGMRIPKGLAEEAGLEAGSFVDIKVKGGDLIVRPARRRKYRLSDLVKKIDSKNVHKEVQTGDAVGKEVW